MRKLVQIQDMRKVVQIHFKITIPKMIFDFFLSMPCRQVLPYRQMPRSELPLFLNINLEMRMRRCYRA